MAEIPLSAQPRPETGSRAAGRLRAAGKIPGVVYGHGAEPMAVAVDGRELRHALNTEAGTNALLSLGVDGGRHLVMARELQRDPVRNTVVHVDFLIVNRDEVVSAEVPVNLVGESEKVRHADGVIEQQLFTLTVHARPGDIPTSIDVDVSGLDVGDAIRVGDLTLPGRVTTDLDAEEAVVVAQGPQRVEDLGAAEGEAAEREGAQAEGEPHEAPGGPGAGEGS